MSRPLHTTIVPPAPTAEEAEIFWRGRCSSQYARKNKKTGVIEFWWTDGDGKWSSYGGMRSPFVCKPAMRPVQANEELKATRGVIASPVRVQAVTPDGRVRLTYSTNVSPRISRGLSATGQNDDRPN